MKSFQQIYQIIFLEWRAELFTLLTYTQETINKRGVLEKN